ncbi:MULTISPECIES: DUF3800 domain-containing protein [Bacillus]|uniref:DUF3800 domain-containing protein n=2 Tax=Bacillaceae TaxID=186817 RepID=UPI0013D2FF1B|nr:MULTISPECIES: DUF3800 domain-containing protein [Bacillus]MDI6563711.1 DUF3800 domain-containing protein [Bacillus subtilis]
MNFDVYCDESGNSGKNFLDSGQPMYVLAGIMVERNQSYRLRNRIIEFRKECYPDQEEIKGSYILKNTKGQKNANILINSIFELGIPFFSIVEKKFMLALKMVETFLDPEYNKSLVTSFTWMNDTKKRIGQIFYNSINHSRDVFGEAYKRPSLELINKAQEELSGELEKTKNSLLAELVTQADTKKIYDEFQIANNSYSNGALASINLPILNSFLQVIERYSQNSMNTKKVRLIHDEHDKYESSFKKIFNQYMNKKQIDSFELEGGQTILTSFKKLKQFEFCNSTASPIVQGVDIYASFLNKVCSKIFLRQNLTPEMNKFVRSSIGGVIYNNILEGSATCEFIVSDWFKNKLYYEIKGEELEDLSIPKEDIIKEFLVK